LRQYEKSGGWNHENSTLRVFCLWDVGGRDAPGITRR
jgi:hypothetical protein